MPGSVTIQKSTGDLAVDCAKENIMGHETIISKSNGAVWGNIILGGGIGYVVDRNTGAGFDYPNSITVMLRKMGETVGLAAPVVAPVTAPAALPAALPVAQATNKE